MSCAPNLRLFQNDASYITLGDVYDLHCEEMGMTREEPTLMTGEKVKATLREFKQRNGRGVSAPYWIQVNVAHTSLAQQGGIL